jgi:hypothetical protein
LTMADDAVDDVSCQAVSLHFSLGRASGNGGETATG